jgi:hypothetical protein
VPHDDSHGGSGYITFMQSLVCLTKRGATVGDSTAVERAAARFRAEHAVQLPGLIAGDLLSTIQRQIEADGFSEHVHHRLPSRPVDLRLNSGLASALLLLLSNDPAFLGVVRTVTGVTALHGFSGAVSRRLPSAGHEDAWHSDAVDGRMAALTINLSAEPYEGGVLQVREEPAGTIAFELANTGPGDAVLFEIDPRLKHRVTAPEGRSARTVFAGWFLREPARRLLNLPPVARP